MLACWPGQLGLIGGSRINTSCLGTRSDQQILRNGSVNHNFCVRMNVITGLHTQWVDSHVKLTFNGLSCSCCATSTMSAPRFRCATTLLIAYKGACVKNCSATSRQSLLLWYSSPAPSLCCPSSTLVPDHCPPSHVSKFLVTHLESLKAVA